MIYTAFVNYRERTKDIFGPVADEAPRSAEMRFCHSVVRGVKLIKMTLSVPGTNIKIGGA